MIFNKEDQEFLEKIAPTRTGKRLFDMLQNVVIFYADIRNVGDVDPKVRIDALRFFEEIIGKMKVLGQDEPERPLADEFT